MSNVDQEHRISYKAGITRTPSDFLCQDGELAECINLTTDNEELKPIVQPAEYISAAKDSNNAAIDMPRFLYIHKFTGDRYIGVVEEIEGTGEQAHTVNVLHWGTLEEDSQTGTTTYIDQGALKINVTDKLYYTDSTKVTSIGKTLIIADSDGIHYYLWDADNNSYKTLNSIPTPKVEFFLKGAPTAGISSMRVQNSQSYEGIIKRRDGQVDTWELSEEGGQGAYNDLVIGLYLKNKKALAQRKLFCEPFFVRTAVELTDGSYTLLSQPILMFPSIYQNSYGYINTNTKDLGIDTYGCELHYIIDSSVDYADWSDIVKNIVVFVSDGIDLYDLTVDQFIPSVMSQGDLQYSGIYRSGTSAISTYNEFTSSGTGADIKDYSILNQRGANNHSYNTDHSEIENEIKSKSIFYKLCEIGVVGDGSDKNIAEKIEKHTLENLTTRPRLEYDDYYSHSILYPDFLYSYNSRLNIANVKRSMFEGFGFFMPYDNDVTVENAATYTFYVSINTDIGTKTVRHIETTRQKQGLWFYYPDTRAKHVMIYKGNDLILDEDLTEHSGLFGAYYFKGLPTSSEPETPITATAPVYSDPTPEILPNYIITSDVNNPFVFPKSGYNKVGIGKILAMSTTTMALSQDQFGKTDLIVFSESGIWGMEVDRTGLYQSIHAVTRDVLINPHNVIQIDGAVFFVTKKGLMVITERVQGGVQCMSERIDGIPFNTNTLTGLATGTDWATIVEAGQTNDAFHKYISSASCMIAYDYIESRLIITNPSYGFSYIYNIAEGTIAKTILPSTITNVVNNYPDYLLRSNETRSDTKKGVVYSFYEKPREEEVNSRQTAFLLTRPMKLSGPVSKDSLRQLKNVGYWDEGTTQTPLSCVKVKIYLSDDLKNWYEDTSRFGAAAKYYRLAFFINMLPSERLSGTIITTQPSRTNNFR